MSWKQFAPLDRNLAISVAECRIACKLVEMGITCYERQKPFSKLITTADFYFPDVNLAVFIDGEQIFRDLPITMEAHLPYFY